MPSLKQRITLETKNLRRASTYLVGVSGGRDSMVLTHLLRDLGFTNLILCHLNHGLRKTGERDRKFVEKFASSSNMRIIYDILPKVPPSDSLESSLRNLRFAFFARTARDTGAEGIFLGHHADDLAETFLWNLLRGSGAEGLSGIQSQICLETDASVIRIFRPMLGIWRTEIDAYVQENGLAFVEDETNLSPRFTRNRFRHDIIPFLEKKLQRNVRQNLHRTAQILNEENRFLEKLAILEDWHAPLSVSALQAQPIALQRRIILAWLQHHRVAEAGFAEVELIRSLLDLQSSVARINLTENRQARRRAGKISLSLQTD